MGSTCSAPGLSPAFIWNLSCTPPVSWTILPFLIIIINLIFGKRFFPYQSCRWGRRPGCRPQETRSSCWFWRRLSQAVGRTFRFCRPDWSSRAADHSHPLASNRPQPHRSNRRSAICGNEICPHNWAHRTTASAAPPCVCNRRDWRRQHTRQSTNLINES